ncbi:hypothetical protein [Devosia sp. MC1541]|uniref:hypothetical protein n=1 Tax=Devosia sp. MC1541 TaxID=2725264 RepID=UPI00145EC52D|nr:hypothetical protein [Devosia sp. MC1541]
MDIRSINVHHASPAIAKRVTAWFERPSRVGVLDGGRSIHLPHPEKRGYSLKIKGAGHLGGEIKFGTYPDKGPTAPRFDFDGRMMVDVASGHDNAFVGGASFQQAATEYRMAREFAGLGIDVVACVGFGSVSTDTHVSWFSIHEWPIGYLDLSADETDNYRLANLEVGQLMLNLAQHHGKVGYFWVAKNAAGHKVAFDLHPFTAVDPLNCSQLSWVMQLAFTYSVRCQACEVFPALERVKNPDPDIAAFPLRALLPSATRDDYLDLRHNLMKPAKQLSRGEFSSTALLKIISSTRIGRVLLDHCPTEYARYAG